MGGRLKKLRSSVPDQPRWKQPPWCWCIQEHSTAFLYGAAVHTPASSINDALLTVTGCLHPTPSENLPVLPGIQPPELRRNGAALSLARSATETGNLLHSVLTCPPCWNARCLKLRHPFVFTVQLVNSSENNGSAGFCADHLWNAVLLDNTTRLRTFITDASTHLPGMALPRTAWEMLNRLCTGVGRF